MTIQLVVRFASSLVLGLLWFASAAMGQTETATISGLITDSTGAVVPGAEVKLQSVDRGTTASGTTNNTGIYVFASVHPGPYQITVQKPGFKQVDFLGLIVNVQDHIEQNFRLQVGSISESITVTGNELNVNTTDATVSTVVDRQFAENLPMNGRSFQTLIELTPGVVLTPSTVADGGQFSVNGQRAVSNYWMVDGVSANFGVGAAGFSPGNGSAGTLPSFSVLGGTNSLVSVDAMQEFRIQTSTYAPEFGRTPGGQISIVTRSGTNQFHGTVFDYLRNDIFDAKDWFDGYTNNPPLPKAKERQNDFGGTLSGPIFKTQTFFFFSYEGLRLRLPQTTLTTVPDASFTPGGTTSSRQNAIPALQPYLNAYPLPSPNSPEIFVPCDPATDPTCPPSGQKPTGSAAFNTSYSDPGTLDAYSLRIDHKLNNKLIIFGRYNYSPSTLEQRGLSRSELSTVFHTTSTIQTATVGTTWSISPTVSDDLRFNYSRADGSSHYFLDNFHGAVPLTSLPFPNPYTNENALLQLFISSLTNGVLNAGQAGRNLQRQDNVTDSVSVQKGSHSFKFGADFRRLSPVYSPRQYFQEALFSTIADAGAGNALFAFLQSARTSALLFHNLGVFAQDTWRIAPRLTLTYGLRWDVDFAPSTAGGPSLLAVSGYNLNDLSKLALAPAGTSPFRTTYGNVAPRIGVAYQLSQSQDWQTVIRAGFGLFYDLASSQAGNAYGTGSSYPFAASRFCEPPFNPGPSCPTGNLTFPLTPVVAGPPPITLASLSPGGGSPLYAFDPKLTLPYTLQWNVAVEQALGKQQTLSASYIGAVGRRLLQTASILAPNPSFSFAELVGNAATSDYDALQVQFQRRLLNGLQALASYSWSHSIDTASAGSFDNPANGLLPASANQNRGPSDFDIRNAFSAGLTYDIPAPKFNPLTNAILHGWSIENVIQARSAAPEDISYQNTFNGFIKGSLINIRPDVVSGQPLYLYGSQYPGGKAFNPAAFTPPPADANGNPIRQGNLGRNALRGFGTTQWDFAVHRDFPIHEAVKLQFRAEMFNVLNHPNFAPPYPVIDGVGFGIATQMLGGSLTDVTGNGGLNPLYQLGGPRSMQFALKLSF
jgi:hypothetical protein